MNLKVLRETLEHLTYLDLHVMLAVGEGYDTYRKLAEITSVPLQSLRATTKVPKLKSKGLLQCEKKGCMVYIHLTEQGSRIIQMLKQQ